LLGGETAEMPGFYADGEYDLAGFIVGAVSRDRIVDGATVRPGDRLIALPSSGLHTNGYSLARKIAFEELGLGVDSVVPELGATVRDVLLRPHRSYLSAVSPLLDRRLAKGMAHITGGGTTENIPRMLPDGCAFELDRASWTIPAVFSWLQRAGQISDAEMFRAFNMGVGLVIACAANDTDEVLATLRTQGEAPWVVGRVC
jgi:phosphoribosylformylglycinamidine cyclo-ligase